MFRTDDTIVAVSTAAGASALAIVRLSGPRALAAAAMVFRPASGALEERSGFRWANGLVRLPAAFIEAPARVYVFRAPRSYTRQDVVELHVPGSPPLARAIVAALLAAGARVAGPGEFTARAFFSGRIDLSRAEAVADLIDAAGDAQARRAADALGGVVHRFCSQASARLADALAMVEASIDLPEEELDLPVPSRLAADLRELERSLREQVSRSADAPDADRTPRSAIAGRPNAGKSSLLNALTGADRAIVCAMAGTTRDVLSAPMELAGATLLLQDAAGFVPEGVAWLADRGKPRPAGAPSDVACREDPASQGARNAAAAGNHGPLHALAHTAARQAVASADIVLFVADLAADRIEEDVQLLAEVRHANPRAPVILAGSKCDLLSEDRVVAALAKLRRADLPAPLAVSSVSGRGLDSIRRALAEQLHLFASRPAEGLALHGRQRQCLSRAADATNAAAQLLVPARALSDAAELAAEHLRDALSHVGRISGEVVSEDILGQIFARFCVGK